MSGTIVEVELRNKARKYLERMNEPHKSIVVDALNKLEREPPSPTKLAQVT
jgi:mRNA-degrading endonuclease RelE of RelBE toxin-antitoxin system